MIKCNVIACGTISRAAEMRTNNSGESFMSFGMKVTVPSRNGDGKTVEISVSRNGEESDLACFYVGERVEAFGTLSFRKRGDNTYLNLSASTISLTGVPAEDSIEGDMVFRGKTGKRIDEKKDRKGKDYIQFSAFSTEKVNEGFEYLWVRFIGFDRTRESWLQPQTSIEAKGDLDLTVYNGRLDISCRIAELSRYSKPQYNPRG